MGTCARCGHARILHVRAVYLKDLGNLRCTGDRNTCECPVYVMPGRTEAALL